MKNLKSFTDKEALEEGAADYIFDKLQELKDKRERIYIVLAGGNTPKGCYRKLADKILAASYPVEKLYWFWGDERWVLPDHSDSNEKMARENLLNLIKAPETNIFSWNPCSNTPVECSAQYSRALKGALEDGGNILDLVILGMGDDGHTASLFPGSRYLTGEATSLLMSESIPGITAAVDVLKLNTTRLTMTPEFLNRGKEVLFLITGGGKKEVFKEVREGNKAYPAAWVTGESLSFFVTADLL